MWDRNRKSSKTNIRNTASYDVMTVALDGTSPHSEAVLAFEHTEPEEQSLPTCSENPAVDRCPATAGVDGYC